MGDELQVRSTPWGWTAFTIFLIAYGNGFSAFFSLVDDPLTWRMWLAFVISLCACYLMMFLDPKNTVRFRSMIAALQGHDIRLSISLCPAWLRSIVLAVALGLLACLSLQFANTDLFLLPDPFAFSEIMRAPSKGVIFGLSILAFLIRDVALILLLNLRPARKRADMAAIFYLIFAYGILPGTLYALEQPAIAAIFLPDPTRFTSLVSALLQAAVLGVLLIFYWQKIERAFSESLAHD